MIISIVNRTETLSDEQVHAAIRAINKQIAYDFEPYWSFGAKLRLEGAVGKTPNREKALELRGDAIIYLWDGADVQNALGYHDKNNRGIPYGFVFTKLCDELKESWTVTLSHEALELLGDAQGNLLVQGPHPDDPNKQIFHWFEMCDAVQAQTYVLDGVEVANFVLPLYFTSDEQAGGRNDFLGQLKGKLALKSFGVAIGGYVGFFDPISNTHDTYSAPDDKKAQRRLDIKKKYLAGRGYLRIHGDATLPKEQEHQLALATKDATTISNDPIRHVVVLMLENRSFDQMLGDTTRIYPDVEGIPQQGPVYQNVSSKSGKVYPQKPNAAAVVKPDPGHDLVDVVKQFGDAATSPMGGFVDSYLDVAGVSEKTPGQVEQVMAYFPLGKQQKNDSLPALHALARNFRVCDHWFSSMPGPTWPNRFFAHTGTSLGHILMPSRQKPGNMRLYNQDTIYDRLGDFGSNWRIYFDGIPQSIVLTHMLPSFMFGPHYSSIQNFVKDAKGPEKDFPDYVFIEPAYSGRNENDQHPPSDIAAGDRLIADIYNAIRSNDSLWKSTLLIVTYDEHGGFFDHVSPPATIAPDGNTKEFDFARLGPRVPAILVSPWVERGVCKTPFDHSSILRYACDKWGLAPLGMRTDPAAGAFQANSFASEISLGKAREDTPASISGPPVVKGLTTATQPPVEGSREALLWFVANLQDGTADAPDEKGRRLAAQAMTSRKGQALRPMTDAQLRNAAERRFDQLLKDRNAGPNNNSAIASTGTRNPRKPPTRKSVKSVPK